MKEIKAYQCETCREIYTDSQSIRKCVHCKSEICDECCSMDDLFCWECYEAGFDKEE